MSGGKEAFLACERFIVVGASASRAKFGNKVLRALINKFGRDRVIPVNPKEQEVEGVRAFADIKDAVANCNPDNTAASIITPPQISEHAIKNLVGAGIRHVWLQPGAENKACIEFGKAQQKQQQLATFLHSGPCLLVTLGFSDDL